MNMTGDPNQRNSSSMFGFECSYPSPSTSFPRFNERPIHTNLTIASDNRMEGSSQCLFTTNSSSPFAVSNSSNSTVGNVPFTPSYLFPSTSSVNLPVYNKNSFHNTPVSSSNAFSENSIPFNIPTTQSTNPFLCSQLNWNPNMKSNFCFPSSSSHASPASYSFSTKPLAGSFSCKRKTNSPPLVPLKQHITEERMAEHMSRLHISSQTPSTKESEPVRERRLYMCEEMQRLQTESIIPAQILERVHRPCTALVPWRPPVVPPLRKENNNNEEEPDLMERSDSNVMEMDS